MLALREHWADDLFERPPEPADETPGSEAPRHPLHRPDGSPIGLRAYCELVTPSYRWDWKHLVYIDSVLDRVTAGELKRVIIELPPRHGKTEKATIRQTSYRLELNPALRVIIAAYNAKFAQKLSRKIRRIVRGRIALSEDRNAAEDWETTEGGGVRALGAGEGTAGLPAELLLIDDPIKNRKQANSKTFRDSLWEWMTEDLFTRLEPNAAVVLTMTRRHEDDPVGRILASEEAKDWTVIKLPALAEENDPLGRKVDEALCPDRYDADALKKIRRGNERMFASLYQQRPAPASGLVFKGEWWQYYTTRDRPIIENGHAVHVLPDVFSSHIHRSRHGSRRGSSSTFNSRSAPTMTTSIPVRRRSTGCGSRSTASQTRRPTTRSRSSAKRCWWRMNDFRGVWQVSDLQVLTSIVEAIGHL
jgi:hypothetical protein